MVVRIKSGKSIRGVLSYNENKVKDSVAQCIEAVGFGCLPEELSFGNKLSRFIKLTERNKIAKTNAIHITLNFHPDEKLSDGSLKNIAATYMEKIGFGDQPYLVYRHFDAAHDHIHIATVNIRSDGTRIDIHDIGRNESEQARKEIEETFRLIHAEGRAYSMTTVLKPADLTQAKYGKRPTKNEISNIVRTVAKSFKYGSFKEYSDILREYNVLASRGEPGTKMHKEGGLVYQLFDKNKNKGVGIPIKSSSIYEKPTLKNIEQRFEQNKVARKQYRQRVIRTVDRILTNPTDKRAFIAALEAENIIADFKTNEDLYIYGITFLDKNTGCFFNGSDIGKAYSAKAILDRLQTGSSKDNAINRDFVEKLLAETDFSKDFKEVLFTWMRTGALVKAFVTESGNTRYKIGRIQTEPESYLPVDGKIGKYLAVNQYGTAQANTIIDFLAKRISNPVIFHKNSSDWDKIFTTFEKELFSILQKLWGPVYSNNALPFELLKEARRKKRRKRN
ncbi:relaxase/mobilization nuclease domain-containing protein [Niabella pedocola]|uniref:Relaxase/mobilization nuclease domain-containing protein n=1 Tax=Niabella pedocola TaxID=1752077 RepID=A0ABS8PTH2_9BACT|nr:relaxase/mobilization nuclease domain-containing protein [Niabella pedocola]MCD2424374.1 relaxase/mobilization nuclease domain-containing protein [Niabella pedocola]